jgi:hypothetical protein
LCIKLGSRTKDGLRLVRTEDGKIKVECSENYVTSLYTRYRLVKKYRAIMHEAVLKQLKQK